MKSWNKQSLLSVIHKKFASGDLAARKARLAARSREQLRADFDVLMSQRRDQTLVEGDELPAEF